MHFLIDVASSVPLYAQIVGQVRAAVASGVLGAGDPLPSVRQLAAELRINPNTVVQAYRELEREGLTIPQRGHGTYVAELPEGRRQDERARVARELAEKLVAEAGRLGLNPSDVRAAIDEVLERLSNR
jgi:GntR family transcriptional regulator